MEDLYDASIDNDTLVMIIERYQKDDMVHQFTCGTCVDSYLEPIIKDNKVYLRCPRCGWYQKVSESMRKLMGLYIARD